MDEGAARRVRLVADVGRREPVCMCTRVIRASISTRISCAAAHIPIRNQADITRQSLVHIIRIDADLVAGRVARHVRIDKRHHRLPRGLVVAPDVSAAQQAALLAGIEVKLQRVARPKSPLHQDPQGLQEHNHAAAIVDRARCTCVGAASCRVEMRTQHHQIVGLTRNLDDDAGLVVRMLELADLDVRVRSGHILDLAVQPIGSLEAGGGPIVAVEEATLR